MTNNMERAIMNYLIFREVADFQSKVNLQFVSELLEFKQLPSSSIIATNTVISTTPQQNPIYTWFSNDQQTLTID